MRYNRRRDIIVSATKVRLQYRVLLISQFSDKIVASPNTSMYDFIGAPLCHCSNRQIAEPEIIEEGEVFRRRRYEESSEEEQSEEEDVDEEVRVVKSGVR